MSFRVFGYGSLVNIATLPPHEAATPFCAKGWRRAWRTTSRKATGGNCALSVEADPDGAIDGLIITFPDTAWPTIAAREKNYDALHLHEDADVIIFKAKAAADRLGDASHPIFLSYIDTTLQGFLQHFGEAGAARFMTSTDGWATPIVNDRAAPDYPRAQQLSRQEQESVDRLLKMVDAAPSPRH
ncbi:MAG: gamma-glutamylcyclotransferase family protein [Pseudomonadota bacterium]